MATPSSFFKALTGGVTNLVGSLGLGTAQQPYIAPEGSVPERMDDALSLYGAMVVQKAARRLRARLAARKRRAAATCIATHARGYRARSNLDQSLWAAEILQATARGRATRITTRSA